MSNLPPHTRLPPSQSPSSGSGSYSSHGSSMGRDSSSMGFGSAVQEQGSRYKDGQYSNLPSNVKLPPSYHSQGHSLNQGEYRPVPMPRPAPQSHDPGSTRGPMGFNAVPTSMSQGGGERSISSGAVPVAEIVRKLDFASNENVKLREVLHENNELLDSKLQEIERCLESSKKLKDENEKLIGQVQQLTTQHTESTNKFFEARVAVLGYKCRTMQLAGELKEKMQQGQPQSLPTPNDAHLQQRIQRLEAENDQLKRAQPGGASAANFQALQREKYELVAEKKNLSAIIAQLTSDLDEVKSKKDAAQRDGTLLGQQMDQLHREHQSLQTEFSTLRGHLQDAHLQKANIEGQLRDEKKKSEDLIRKVKELEESRSTLHGKLQRQSQEHPVKQKVPTPKPRTNLQSAAGVPLQVKGQLESEKREIQEQLDREKNMRETVETQLHRERQKLQEMIQKQNHLEHDVVSLKSELEMKSRHEVNIKEELQTLRVQSSSGSGDKLLAESLQRNVDRKEKHITSLMEEKDELQSRIAQLEKALTEHRQEVSSVREDKQKEVTRVKQDKERKISELEEQLRQLSLKSAESEASSNPVAAPRGKQQQSLAIKLNNAKGTIKEQEDEIKKLQRKLTEEKERFEEEKSSLVQQNTKLQQEVVVDYHQKLQTTENRITHLQRQITELEQEEQRLITDSLRHTEEKDRLRQELSLKDGNFRDLQDRLTSVQRQLSEKLMESEQLNGRLTQVQSQLSVEEQTKNEHSERMKFLEDKLSRLNDVYTRTKSELQSLQDEKQQLHARVHELNEEKTELSKQWTVLIEEKADVETTCNEFQKESESILKDYDSCAQRLQEVTKERDSLRSELNKIAGEASKQGDRMKQLEQQRDDVQERLTHMDAQLKIYHEDFERERQAREAAIKVKSLAEERMKKMERDMRDLRERLNRQAAKRLQEDQYEDPSALSTAPLQEARLSGEQQRNLSGPQQFTQPPPVGGNTSGNQLYGQPQQTFSQAGQQQYGGPPQAHTRRSGEQFIQQSMAPAHQEQQAPPIPPRERPLPQAQLPATSIGGGYPMQQPANQPWTTQFPQHHQQQQQQQQQGPPMVQPSGRVHPMTVVQGQPIPQRRMEPPNDLNQRPPMRAMGPGPATMAPVQMPLNDLNMPPQTTIGIPGQPQQQGRYVSPGEVMNAAPPMASCPLCGKKDFTTQTDLELHCAQCTADIL